MKKFFSLSELGSCCRPQAAPALAAAVRDEARACASGSHAPPRRLRRASSRRCSPAAQWQPGLPAISEDGAAVISAAARQAAGVVAGKANPTARSKAVGSTANNKSRSYGRGGGGSTRDEPRTNSMPVIIPAFSPTPFVF